MPYLPMAVRSLFPPLSSVAAHIGVEHSILLCPSVALSTRLSRAMKRLRVLTVVFLTWVGEHTVVSVCPPRCSHQVSLSLLSLFSLFSLSLYSLSLSLSPLSLSILSLFPLSLPLAPPLPPPLSQIKRKYLKILRESASCCTPCTLTQTLNTLT